MVPNSLLVDLLDYSLSCSFARGLENNLFENLEALVFELRDGLHFYVIPVEILKEESHPLDHYLVISPPFIQPSEELLARLSFKVSLNVYLQVVFD